MKFLRDPLFHFVLLGAALFVVYAVTTGLFFSGDARRIEIDAAAIDFIRERFERQLIELMHAF